VKETRNGKYFPKQRYKPITDEEGFGGGGSSYGFAGIHHRKLVL
jgi:hypothetical protein